MAEFENSLCMDSGYGALACNLPDHRDEKFYLTTAISYTNGYPHIGHAYEFISCDAIVRYHRVLGYDTFFLTGTDEHGQKVAASAEKEGRTPLEHCNLYVRAFKELDKSLLVTYSDFVRTTDPFHELNSKSLWKMCHDKGDIYLGSYEGWYNEREENFVTDADAEALGFKDPSSGVPLKRVKEESYFFRMSAYTERLIAHIEANPSFIEPEQYRKNILARLHKEGLKDLSVSRTSFRWGIPVPEGFDQNHVMYVWFDALTNYISGVDGLGLNGNIAPPSEDDRQLGTNPASAYLETQPTQSRSEYWPAAKHVIGKDIVWFHGVIWPCMLMSAGVPLPGGVFSHGFVNAADGRKMSKSFNNTVSPGEILDKYSVDTIRYYFCSGIYGSDLNFMEEALVMMHNSELADVLGNLVHRVMNLCHKFCGGKIPAVAHAEGCACPFDLAALKLGVTQDLKSCAIHAALFKAMDAARSTNRFLTEAEPWKLKGPENEQRRQAIVRTTLEAVYAFSHFLAPVIPVAAGEIFKKLHTSPVSCHNLRDDFYNLAPGTPVTVGDILFQKIEVNTEAAAADGAKGSSTQASTASKGESKPKGGKASKVPAVEEEAEHQIDFTKIDLRVGRINKVWNHPTAERLFCEEIDVGEQAGGIRQVASGLRAHYTVENLQDKLVVVVCNLKESKFQGFLSQGMVLAAKGTEQEQDVVELVSVPEGSTVGERVYLEGYKDAGNALAPARVKKLKVWEAMSPDLRANNEGLACWKEMPMRTSAGNCTVSHKLSGAAIS